MDRVSSISVKHASTTSLRPSTGMAKKKLLRLTEERPLSQAGLNRSVTPVVKSRNTQRANTSLGFPSVSNINESKTATYLGDTVNITKAVTTKRDDKINLDDFFGTYRKQRKEAKAGFQKAVDDVAKQLSKKELFRLQKDFIAFSQLVEEGQKVEQRMNSYHFHQFLKHRGLVFNSEDTIVPDYLFKSVSSNANQGLNFNAFCQVLARLAIYRSLGLKKHARVEHMITQEPVVILKKFLQECGLFIEEQEVKPEMELEMEAFAEEFL